MRSVTLVLLLACAAGLAAHSALAESTPRSIRITDDAALAKRKKPAKAPASCGDNKGKHDCLKRGADEGECAWCEGSYMPASCLSAAAAKYLPETVAKCKLPKKHKDVTATAYVDTLARKKKPAKAPASCGDNKHKHDCLKLGADEGECAWCEGGYMPASCMSATAAKYLPETVAKCKLPKKHKEDVVATVGTANNKKKKPAKAPASCGDNKGKHDCLKRGADEGECAWCEGSYMPASCMSATAAEYLPETVAKCKLPKRHNAELADESALEGQSALKKKSTKKSEKSEDGSKGSGGDWPSGGGDWPSGGGSSGGSGGDYPHGPGGGSSGKKSAGKGCKDLHSKHKCMKGSKSEGACAWCAKGSMVVSEGCVSEKTIHWLPKMVADCKVGKDRRKKASVQVA